MAAGLGSITHRDVSPVVKLLDEYQVYFVKTDSPIRGARDVVNELKKDPASLSFGFSTAAGNPLHISIANIARLAGSDPAKLKAVAYWDQALSAVIQSDLIKKDLESNSWTVDLIGHRELPAFLEKEYQNYRRVLTDMGMVK